MRYLLILILSFLSALVYCQEYTLKSTEYGLDMMLRDMPKEKIIEEIRFESGKNDTINVIRFDHVGPNMYPLLISSELPITTDSLGILSFKLQKDTLHNFLWMINHWQGDV